MPGTFVSISNGVVGHNCKIQTLLNSFDIMVTADRSKRDLPKVNILLGKLLVTT
jgi:hypothetical protein